MLKLQSIVKSWIKAKADSGSTLIPVVVLTTIGIVIVAIIGTQILSSYGFTARSKAHIQAEAAAESGLIVGQKIIEQCRYGRPSFDVTLTNPRVTLEIRTFPKGTGTGVASCPTTGDSVIRVNSLGYSTLPNGLFGNTPYMVKMQQVFNYSVTGPIIGGPAALLGGNTSFPFPVTRYGDNGTSPLVFSLGFDCSPGPSQTLLEIPNDVIVLDGVLKVNTGCRILGNVWAKTVTYNGGQILGTITPITGDPNQQLPVPIDQKWITIAYNPDAWLDVGFDKVLRLPGASVCNFPSSDATGTGTLNKFISGLTTSTVLDGYGNGCGPNGISGDMNVTLTSDLVIYADKFSLQRVKARSGDGGQYRIWLVVPDTRADTSLPPSCAGSDPEKITVKDIDMDISKISIFFYTTGPVYFGNPRPDPAPTKEFRGQIVACQVKSGNLISHFYFDPMGVPEFDLNSGDSVGAGDYPRTSKLIFKRDIVK